MHFKFNCFLNIKIHCTRFNQNSLRTTISQSRLRENFTKRLLLQEKLCSNRVRDEFSHFSSDFTYP